MSFLDEAVYNVEKGATPPDPKDLEDDDVINIGEKSPDNLGYGKDPETGEFKSMSSNDAIKHFIAQIKQDIEDEGDEWPAIKEDLAKFIRKAGGAEYKTPFTDLVKSYDDWVEGDKNNDDKSPEEREKLIKQFANIHKAPQDKFDAFVKEVGELGWENDDITKLIKKQKEYKAEQNAAEKKKEEDDYKEDVKEIVKKCLNRGMIKENISKVVKKYLAEVKK